MTVIPSSGQLELNLEPTPPDQQPVAETPPIPKPAPVTEETSEPEPYDAWADLGYTPRR